MKGTTTSDDDLSGEQFIRSLSAMSDGVFEFWNNKIDAQYDKLREGQDADEVINLQPD